MSDHLSSEQFAAFVDDHEGEWPEDVGGRHSPESSHLLECDACRAQFQSMRKLHEALGALTNHDPPEGEWGQIIRRLKDE